MGYLLLQIIIFTCIINAGYSFTPLLSDEKFILSDTYIVKVLSTIDTIANTTSCIQPSAAASMSIGCNLRSAWEVCLNVIHPAGIHCVIELPDTAYLPMNISYGSLLIKEGAITIHGNNSTIRSIDQSLYSHRPLILCDTTQANIIPELSIYNLFVTGFHSDSSDGGAMSFVGDIDLLLSDITFIDNNSSSSGGAVSIDRNSYRSRIHKCIFESCQSEENGGAISIGSNNDNIILSMVTIDESIAHQSGGGVYVGVSNDNIQMDNIIITSCMSYSSGGGIQIDSQNKNLVLRQIKADHCSSEIGDGGALSIFQYNNNVIITNSTFSFSTASYGDGGAISIDSYNSYINIEGSTIDHCNVAGDKVNITGINDGYGGGVSVYKNNHHIKIVNCSFSHNAASYGGGVSMSTDNHHIDIVHSTFSHNSGLRGGGIFIRMSNYHVNITLSTFSYNTASDGGGGGVLMYEDNHHIDIVHSTFSHNSGHWGGGIMIRRSNYHVNITLSTFSYNAALDGGGGVLMDEFNHHIDIVNSTLSHNSGFLGGGIIIRRSNNYVNKALSTFSYNTASYDGGGVYMHEKNHHINIVHSTFSHNSGHLGGGIIIRRSNYHVNITLSTFSYNTASYGGGVSVYDNNHHIYIVHSNFSHNSGLWGGGIDIELSNYHVDIVRSTFSNNFGYSGGGVYLYSSNKAVHVVGSEFSGNTAKQYGGAIYVGDNCTDFMIIDVEGYDKLKTNQVSCVVHSDTIVYLDQVSYCDVSYHLDATDINRRGVLWNNFNPGITTAPLIISNGSINITYDWDLSNYFYQYCRRPKLISVPIVNNPVHKSLFVKNSAYQSGGAIYFNTNNMFIKVINAEFRENEALLNGGAIDMEYGNQGAIFADLNIISNTAKESGGAVYSFTNNLGAKFYKSTFHSNRAGADGGAISFQQHNGRNYFPDDSNNTINYCVFDYNSASSFAGAVHVDDGNSIIINNTHMMYNNAAEGGAIQMGSITSKVKSGGIKNNVIIQNSIFHHNYAKISGGFLFVVNLGSVSMTSSDIQHNKAKEVGGAIGGVNSYVYLTGTNVSYNSAGRGGAICISNKTSLKFINQNTMSFNNARAVGGAIASFDSDIIWVEMTTLFLSVNEADRGSAIYLYRSFLKSSHYDSFTTVHFLNNKARIGGTLYWIKDDVMKSALDIRSFNFMKNIAPYGNTTATQATSVDCPTTYNVSSYLKSMTKALNFTAVDYYKNHLIRFPEDVFIFKASIKDRKHDCSGRIPTISRNEISFTNKVASFDNLQVTCAPGGTVNLTITADQIYLSELDSSKYQLTAHIQVKFRACHRGEVEGAFKFCDACSEGTYSLVNTVDEKTKCEYCGNRKEIDTCSADQIKLKKDYWRRSDESDEIFTCNGVSNGCEGGIHAGDASCSTGYDGVLCGSCSTGYYSSSRICRKCLRKMSLEVILTICFMVVVGFAVIYRILGSFLLKYRLYNEFFSQLTVQLKIIIATFQIVASSSYVLSVDYPNFFTSFAEILAAFNVDIMSIIPIQCSFHFSFLQRLVLQATSPVAVVLLLSMFSYVEYKYLVWKFGTWESERFYYEVKNRYLACLFYFSYLILPSITSAIFPFFVCTEVEKERYLVADMNLNCGSNEYRYGAIYAAFMVLVYPIGIPMMYLWMLYQVKNDIIAISKSYRDGNKNDNADASDGKFNVSSSRPIIPVMRSDSDNGATSNPSDTSPENEPILNTSSREHRSISDNGEISSGDDPITTDPMTIQNDNSVSNSQGLDSPPRTTTSRILQFQQIDDRSNLNSVPDNYHLNYQHNTMNFTIDMNDDIINQYSQLFEVKSIRFLWEPYKGTYWYWEVIESYRRIIFTAVLSVIVRGTNSQAALALILSMISIKLYQTYQPYREYKDEMLSELAQYQILFTFFIALLLQASVFTSAWSKSLGIIMILVNLLALLIFFYCGYDLFRKIANKGLIFFQQFGRRNTNEQIFDSNIHKLDSDRSAHSMDLSIVPEQDNDSIGHLNTIYDYEDIYRGGTSRSACSMDLKSEYDNDDELHLEMMMM